MTPVEVIKATYFVTFGSEYKGDLSMYSESNVDEVKANIVDILGKLHTVPTVQEIKEAVLPIAQKYNIEEIYLCKAPTSTTESIQIEIDAPHIKGLKFLSVACEIEVALGRQIILTTLKHSMNTKIKLEVEK